jgi:hypothetical protein
MNVTVEAIERCEGSVTVARGIDDDGFIIRFAGDARPLAAIAEALEAGEDVEVELEDWQILRRWQPITTTEDYDKALRERLRGYTS